MFRKIVLFLTPLLILTILFLVLVLFLNRETGKGALQVTSQPSAQVFLNDKFIGKSPLCLCELQQLLKVGDYNIKLIPTEEGMKEWTGKITIYQGALTVVDRTFDKKVSNATGSTITLSDINDKSRSELMVLSFPTGAEVVVDSDNKGTTPLLLKDVTASDHEVKILKDGYKEKVVKIKTVPGKRLQVTVDLGIRTDLTDQNASPSATLSLTPTPGGSQKVVILTTPTGFLRVRESANVSSAEVEKVNPGDKFDLISEQDGWYQITLPDGKTGWISSDYAKKE